MSISIDQNRAAFAAYTKLTVVSRFENRMNNHQSYSNEHMSMNFSDFLDVLKNNEVVNKSYVRNVPIKQREDSLINSLYNGNMQFENEKLSYIEKAYNLGMVDGCNILINRKV